MKKTVLYSVIFLFLFIAGNASAIVPTIIYSQPGNIQISSPETSQAFYDNLNGKPRDYYIDSSKGFELYINILVPEIANRDGIYSANVLSLNGAAPEQIASLDGTSFEWHESYDSSIREYYSVGPEFSQQLPAGKYKIEVYSKDNQGKYVLDVGHKESYTIQSTLNVYWQLPLLKLTFFKTSVLQFFLTPYGIYGIGVLGALLVFIALIYYLIGLTRAIIKHNEAKTLLLSSGGMLEMKDEIMKLLQEPAYDVKVAFITTAAKPEENLDYLQKDWSIMKDELGFNVEEVDIEGKNEHELLKLLEENDIIYVEGGNTFYLLNAMRQCNFEKVIRNLLKQGKVYIGVSAGSIVAGKTIRTSNWKNPEPDFGVKDLKGLNLVPFDIFVHYQPEHAEVIKQNMPNSKKRLKDLKILTDKQAILVQGKEVDLIGEGEAVIV